MPLVLTACREDECVLKYLHHDRKEYRSLITNFIAEHDTSTNNMLFCTWASAIWTCVANITLCEKKLRIRDMLYDSIETEDDEMASQMHAYIQARIRKARKRARGDDP